jgi:hypothetical protein
MNWIRWTKRNKARELDEEIEADFALEIQRRLETGATQEEAQFAARREFSNVTRVKEVTREMWGWGFLERLLQDTRYAQRRFRKAPAFTITTVLTLALGIGATTSIFTVLVQMYKRRELRRRVDVRNYAATTAAQIAGMVFGRPGSFPTLNWCFLIFAASSTPRMVTAAVSKRLKPSIGPIRCFTRR